MYLHHLDRACAERFLPHIWITKKQLHFYNCLIFRAENETRTRDPNLGKVVLYQLSYFRISLRLRVQIYAFSISLQIF